MPSIPRAFENAICLLHSESLSIWSWVFGKFTEWHGDRVRGLILAMLRDIRPFFDEVFTCWRVLFVTTKPGTLTVCSSMSVPSPVSSLV
jgi:hypothetical protein